MTGIALMAFVTLVLVGMAGIAIVNTLTFPRLGNAPPPETLPLVSVLIPARNEAAVIASTVRRLLAQTYPHFEVILLDDHSTDDTATIAQAASNNDSRLRVIRGQALPRGWLGKNWACHQLAQEASGELLIFTDADVQWQPNALMALVSEIEHHRADLLTVWPTQETITWGERLVVPLMGLVVMSYLPLPLVHYTRWTMFAAANGQCLAFRRATYEAIGGHQTVHNQVLEDVTLARRVKAQGANLWMVDGNRLVGCRMYESWPAVRDGFGKNILAGYGSQAGLMLATVFHWGVFLGPWLALPWQPALAASLIALSLTLRALTAAATHQRLADALLMPLSVLLMTRIAGQALWWQWRFGGPQWKGRIIRWKP